MARSPYKRGPEDRVPVAAVITVLLAVLIVTMVWYMAATGRLQLGFLACCR